MIQEGCGSVRERGQYGGSFGYRMKMPSVRRGLSVLGCLMTLTYFCERFAYHITSTLEGPDPVPFEWVQARTVGHSRQGLRLHKIGVVIRSFADYKWSTLSLLFQLEHIYRTHLQKTGLSLDCVVVATEFASVPVLIEIVEQYQRVTQGKLVHSATATAFNVEVLHLTEKVYRSLPQSLCSSSYRLYLRERRPDVDRAHLCATNSAPHYFLTDMAIEHLLDSASPPHYLLVTNGDNMYHSSFFTDAIDKMGFKDESGGTRHDMVLTNFVHRHRPMVAKPIISRVDLGSVLFRVDFLVHRNLTSFVDAMEPTKRTPKDFFEADGNLVESVVRKGARTGYVRKYSFYHN